MKARRMPNLWESSDDLSARLNGGLFRYDGRVVMVQYDGEGLLLLLEPSTGKRLGKINPKDERLDVSSLELGYMNLIMSTGLGVRYAQRRTSKRYQQGVSSSTTSVLSISGEESNGTFQTPEGQMAYVIGSKGFIDSVEGRFPEVDAAISAIQKGGSGAEFAVSQSVAMKSLATGLVLIYYRTKHVGHFDTTDRLVKVAEGPRGEFVREELETLGFKVKH